uniref:Uncharacterized protein n=1 Tax=Salvator merianae TaxID=96440 RepID=A0A8D0BSC7_SALMN
MKCGLTEEEQHHQAAMIRSSENIEVEDPELEWWTHTRYADIAIVVEHQRYIKFDRNESTTLLHILNIMDISNLLYEALGVHLTTVGVEIWSEKNLIEITNNINDTLKIFNEWRRDSLLKRVENDAAHLFAYKYFGEIHGLSYFAEICSPEKASGVESYRASSLFLLSNIFVHELGHNLGIQHDGKYCYCERSFCIMSDVLTYSDRFSNCSYRDYFRLRNTGCLLIPPDPKKIYKVKLCGNAVVDEGEQCDCGSPAKCVFDPCCQSDCTLRPDAICAFGECCYDCQYVPAGTTCREEDGICDLPEYCNGTSEWCPEDVYVQDGAPCNNGIYCYHGKCTTHEVQCRDIFGDRATAASESCFRLLNAQGDRFGNCGLRHGVYEKCTAENILCGRIQCENVEELPSLQEHSTVIQTAFGNRQCWSVDYHPGMKIFDIGKIVDGTPCSTDMLCIDGKSEETVVNHIPLPFSNMKLEFRSYLQELEGTFRDILQVSAFL